MTDVTLLVVDIGDIKQCLVTGSSHNPYGSSGARESAFPSGITSKCRPSHVGASSTGIRSGYN